MSPEDKAMLCLIAIIAFAVVAVFSIYRFTGGVWPV